MFPKYIAENSRKKFKCEWTTALTCWVVNNFTKRLGFYKSWLGDDKA